MPHRQRATNSVSEVAGATRACPSEAVTILLGHLLFLGAGPYDQAWQPTTMAQVPRTAAKRSGGHSFDGQPAPGLTMANPAASSVAVMISRARASSAAFCGRPKRTGGKVMFSGASTLEIAIDDVAHLRLDQLSVHPRAKFPAIDAGKANAPWCARKPSGYRAFRQALDVESDVELQLSKPLPQLPDDAR